MPVDKVIGIFGGTFDPVHNGHVQMAVDARDALELDEVRIVPCHLPPHRDTPLLTSGQRIELLSLALDGQQNLLLDCRELERSQLSYTVDTLHSFRQELGDDVSLVLIMGMDAYKGLASWHRWQELRGLAHLLVMARPGAETPCEPLLQQWLEESDAPDIIRQQPCGGLITLNRHLLDISSTQVRESLCKGDIVNDLPVAVLERIQSRGWYQS